MQHLPEPPNISPWRTIFKRFDENQNSTSTTQVEDTELRFPMKENSRYWIRGKLIFFADSGSDVSYDFKLPNGATIISYTAVNNGQSGTGTLSSQFADNAASLNAALTALRMDYNGFRRAKSDFDALISTTEFGEFVLKWSANTAAGGGNTVQLYAGSFIEYLEILVEPGITTK